MVPSLAFVGGLVVDSRRSKFHVADPILEYIDFLSDMHFDKQEFIALHKFSPYYASIMLNAFRHLLCSLLCQHNRRVPNHCLTGNKKFVGVQHNVKPLEKNAGEGTNQSGEVFSVNPTCSTTYPHHSSIITVMFTPQYK